MREDKDKTQIRCGHSLQFTFSPVQSFVAQARKTRDLWSGSYLLSYLAGAPMLPIRDHVAFPSEVAECLRRQRNVDELLNDVHRRRRAIARRRGGKVIEATTAERLVIGLGSHHPLETGLLFHRTLGVPYIPGSSIKGLIRAWADPGDDEAPGWGALDNRRRVLELFWRHR